MPEENNTEEKKQKLKKPIETSVEVGITFDDDVENASDIVVYEAEDVSISDKSRHVKLTRGSEEKGTYEVVFDEDVNFDLIYQDGAKCLELFNVYNMKERVENGESVKSICNDLRTFILQNKDTNPDLVQYAIAQLLGNCQDFYDEGTDNIFHASGYNREHQGDNSEEILGKVLDVPVGEQLHGFVCTTISEFGMRLLDECGIPAVMLSGINHTTLLYQRSDGKFVQSNYSHSYTLNAPTIKDAAREVYKRHLALDNNGYIYFVDNHGSYQEFALKDEAMWGDELDKRDYNSEGVFSHEMADNSSLSGNINYSGGLVSADVTAVLASTDGVRARENILSIGFQQNGVTTLADSSKSAGIKFEHKGETALPNGKKYAELKVVADVTQLHTDGSTQAFNYMSALQARSAKNPEQIAQLSEFFGNEFDQSVSGDVARLQSWLEDCLLNINNFDVCCRGDSPISQEQFIQNYINENIGYYNKYDAARARYTNEPATCLDDLSESSQECIQQNALSNWKNYITENRYNGALEIWQERIEDYQYKIDNHDSLRQEYVEHCLDGYGVSTRITTPEEAEQKTTDLDSYNSTNITAFVRHVFGREHVILDDSGVKLTRGWQLGSLLGVNLTTFSNENDPSDRNTGVGGDFRLSGEYGIKCDVSGKRSLLTTALSGGVLGDFSLKDGTLTPTISTGVKGNGSMAFQTSPSDNVSIGASLSGYGAVTRQSVDYGAEGKLQVAYKPQGSNVTIFGGIGTGVERQRLNMGGFSVKSENISTLGATLGVQLKNSSKISLNYKREDNKLNPTRNQSIISATAQINL